MKTPPTIGVLSPFVSGFYFGSVIRGIAGAATEAGARVLAVQTFEPSAAYTEGADGFSSFHVASWAHMDGCVVVLDGATPTYVEAIKRSGKPVVMISRTIDGLECPVVKPDNRIGMREAVRHLIDHGHRKIRVRGHDAPSRHPRAIRQLPRYLARSRYRT